MFCMWIQEFDLFLFDFDGLLVDTEQLHFLAYQLAFEKTGQSLDLSFDEYCRLAHVQLTNGIAKFATDFDEIKRIKSTLYLDLLQNEKIQLMPGASDVLQQIHEVGKTSCVVTNSTKDATLILKEKLEDLHLISHWLTREDVKVVKPDPSGYLQAIKLYGKKEDRTIGFEDTPKGIEALCQTKAEPILIAPYTYFGIEEAIKKGASHFESFSSMSSKLVS